MVLLTLVLAGALSLALTVLYRGVDWDLPRHWARAYLLSWLVAFPLALVVAPGLRRLAEGRSR